MDKRTARGFDQQGSEYVHGGGRRRSSVKNVRVFTAFRTRAGVNIRVCPQHPLSKPRNWRLSRQTLDRQNTSCHLDHLKMGHRPHDTLNCGTLGEAALTERQQRRHPRREARGVHSRDLAGSWPETIHGRGHREVVLQRATKRRYACGLSDKKSINSGQRRHRHVHTMVSALAL